MSFKLSMAEYPVSGVNKLLATQGGKHIYNVTAGTECWNGALIKRGDWNSFDNYEEAAATEFDGIVRQQAANGNWYVEVVDAHDALLVYNVPIVEADFTRDMASEKHFYIEAGEVCRAHELAVGDIFELSEDGFEGTPVAGATVSGVTDKKPTIGAQGATGATGA